MPERDARELQHLREVDAFKTRFLNMAAHELNTPLTPMKLQMHLVLSGQLGEVPGKQRHALQIVDRNVRRIQDLVKEILDVARMQGGGLRFRVETFDVSRAVAEAVDTYAATAKGIGVTLAADVPSNLVVKTDRNRLTQILMNLVSNALKFTPSGGDIRVHGRTHQDTIVVEIADTGMGLRPDQIAQLFRPFVQVHDPMQITSPGTGLGLYISRTLAEAMGGTLTCRSPGPGKGSTFTLTLPRSMEALPAPPAPAPPVHRTPDDLARRLRELI